MNTTITGELVEFTTDGTKRVRRVTVDRTVPETGDFARETFLLHSHIHYVPDMGTEVIVTVDGSGWVSDIVPADPKARAHWPVAPDECGEQIRQTGGCEHDDMTSDEPATAADEPIGRTWATEANRLYREYVQTVARRLRDMADDVERSGLHIGDAAEGHQLAAGRALHAMMWGMANASADSLPRYAAEADRAREEARR